MGIVLAQLAVLSCDEATEHTAPAIHDRDSASMMVSYGVNTLISDSGVIKYKIVTERWDVNTIKNPTRWTFEKGVFFEQYSELLAQRKEEKRPERKSSLANDLTN